MAQADTTGPQTQYGLVPELSDTLLSDVEKFVLDELVAAQVKASSITSSDVSTGLRYG